jgi:hypothetical protein
MNNKKHLLVCLTIVLASFQNAAGQDGQPILPTPDMKTYEIWTTSRSWGEARKRVKILGLFNGWWGKPYHFERFDLNPDCDLVRRLPREARMVIALHTEHLPEEWLERNNSAAELADALGNFTSLAEARTKLLADWKGPGFYPPFTLKMQLSDNMIFVDTNMERGRASRRYNKFAVDSPGGISLIAEPSYDVAEELHTIDYDREKILNDYIRFDGYTCLLNGEKIDLYDVYLDPDNVASVTVGDYTRTVSIEQKDKNSPWFSITDIEPSKAGISEVKSIHEARMWVDLRYGKARKTYDYFVIRKTKQFVEETRVERSLVAGTGTEVYKRHPGSTRFIDPGVESVKLNTRGQTVTIVIWLKTPL